MTTPHDPRQHPLQDDEVDLARVLRALPAAEPSSKLDAAILGAAADAVAGTPAARPRRRIKAERWLPTWAIGTAAAAVLAIGVGSQLLPPLAPTQDAAPPAGHAAPRSASPDRLDVDLIERKREYPPTFPPPAAEKATARPDADQPAPPPPPPAPAAPPAPVVQSAPAPTAFPETVPADAGAFAPPPQEAEQDTIEVTGSRLQQEEPAPPGRLRQSPAELNRLDAERRAQARDLEQLRAAREEASRDESAALGAAAPAPAADTAETSRREGVSPLADADDAAPAAADAQASTSPQLALPPVAADADLAPADWIERIRARWRGGDREGALASLRQLRERHPDVVIPADLQALR